METTLEAPTFDIGTTADLDELRRAFRVKRRLHVPEFLDPAGAEALHEHLAHKVEWSYFLFNDKHLWEVPAEVRRDYTPEQHQKIVELAYASAQDGYSFLYETSPRSSRVEGALVRAAHKSLLREFEAFLNSPRILDYARRLTGAEDIARVEATATRFRPGHFLAPHDDSAVDTRRAAYVFNLTRTWRIEWGGLLEFIDAGGHVEEAWVPRFNSFNIFGVPQAHAVSCVSPFAGVPRLAVSGWFHAAG
jgi:Rps23 Pro-64 3,4-dihydroxylase Tpa1-like proline 4-hydroxylase